MSKIKLVGKIIDMFKKRKKKGLNRREPWNKGRRITDTPVQSHEELMQQFKDFMSRSGPVKPGGNRKLKKRRINK